MATPHRLLMAIPAARQAAVINFWDSQIDPGQGANTWNVGLSASGTAPAQAYWASAALTDAQCVAILRQLATMAGIAVPSGASLATRQQKIDWITANAPSILSATNIRIVRDDNDQTWSDPEALLTAAGMQRVVAP